MPNTQPMGSPRIREAEYASGSLASISRPPRSPDLSIEEEFLEFLDGDPNWFSQYISQRYRMKLSSPRRPTHAALYGVDHDTESTPRACRTVSAPTGGASRDPVTQTIRRTFSQPAIRSFAVSMQNRFKSRGPPPPLPIPSPGAIIPGSEPPTPCSTTPLQTPRYAPYVDAESPPMHMRTRLAQEQGYHFCCRGEDEASPQLDYRLSSSSGWAARLFASPECQSILTEPFSSPSTSSNQSAYTAHLEDSPLRTRSASPSPLLLPEPLLEPLTVKKRKYPALWTDSLSLTSSSLLTPESPSPGSLNSAIEDSPLSPFGPVTPTSCVDVDTTSYPQKASDMIRVGLHLRARETKSREYPILSDGMTMF